MSLPKDYRYGERVYATVRTFPGSMQVEVSRNGGIKQYEQFADLPLTIRKPLALLMLNPTVEYVENIGRVMGSHAFWIYKPKKETTK